MSTINPGLSPSTNPAASTPPKPNNAVLTAMLSAPGAQPAPSSRPAKWTPESPRLPATLMRTPQGLEVRTSRLTEAQRAVYGRLLQSLGSAQRVNEALTLMATGGVDALGKKLPDLSVDNMAGLSVLSNGLNSGTVVHDATHALLGSKNNIPYGVSEFEEGVGNAVVNSFIDMPKGVYEAFSVSNGKDGKPKLAIDPTKLEAVTSAFNETISGGTSRLQNLFAGSIRSNSDRRIDASFKLALKSSATQKTIDARANEFVKQLQLRGQLPPNTDLAFVSKLKEIYKKYETGTLGSASKQAKDELDFDLNFEIASLLVGKSVEAFKAIPPAKLRQLHADGIAMVLAVNSAYPRRVDVPSPTSKELFDRQWVKTPTDAANFADKGFVRKFLAIRNQVREALGVGAKGRAEPQTASQTAAQTTQQPVRLPNTPPNAKPAQPGATRPANEPAANPAASPGKPRGSSQGGRVQQPDARPRPTLEDLREASGIKPAAKPILDKPRGGLLHPPSEPHQPERLGGYQLPEPNRRPTHTGNTLPKPDFNPNLPGFPRLPEGFKAPIKKPVDSPAAAPTGGSAREVPFVTTHAANATIGAATRNAATRLRAMSPAQQSRTVAQWAGETAKGRATEGARALGQLLGTAQGVNLMLEQKLGGVLVNALARSGHTDLLQTFNTGGLLYQASADSRSTALRSSADALNARISSLQARRTNAQLGTGEVALAPPSPSAVQRQPTPTTASKSAQIEKTNPARVSGTAPVARTAYRGKFAVETDRPSARRPAQRTTQAPTPVVRPSARTATPPSRPPEIATTPVQTSPTGQTGRGTASQLYDRIESIKSEAQRLSQQGQAGVAQVKRVVGELNSAATELRKNAQGWIDQLPAAAQGAAKQALDQAQGELDSFLRDLPQNTANAAEAISGPLTAVLTMLLAFLSVAIYFVPS